MLEITKKFLRVAEYNHISREHRNRKKILYAVFNDTEIDNGIPIDPVTYGHVIHNLIHEPLSKEERKEFLLAKTALENRYILDKESSLDNCLDAV